MLGPRTGTRPLITAFLPPGDSRTFSSNTGPCSGPHEPPCTDPYARWCGGTGRVTFPPTRFQMPPLVYFGWLGRGNIRANGHPGGTPWRQLQCVPCHGYFSETYGTIFHGKRRAPELIVRVIACLAEG